MARDDTYTIVITEIAKADHYTVKSVGPTGQVAVIVDGSWAVVHAALVAHIDEMKFGRLNVRV